MTNHGTTNSTNARIQAASENSVSTMPRIRPRTTLSTSMQARSSGWFISGNEFSATIDLNPPHIEELTFNGTYDEATQTWSGTWEGDESDVRRVDPKSGEVVGFPVPPGGRLKGIFASSSSLRFSFGV